MWTPAIAVTPPAQEPVTLTAAKEFLRVDADLSSFDIEIGAAIAGSRGMVEDLTGTRMITQTVDVVCSDWFDLARLPIGPVQSVTSLKWRDDENAEATIDAGTIELTGGGLARGIRPKPGFDWPYTGDRAVMAKRAADQRLTITARLVVGYGADGTTLPASLYAAILLGIRSMFDDKPVDVARHVASYEIWRP